MAEMKARQEQIKAEAEAGRNEEIQTEPVAVARMPVLCCDFSLPHKVTELSWTGQS